MAHEIYAPSFSAGTERMTIARWLVASGDRVRAGQAIAEIETDKVTMELEATHAGRLGPILVRDGQEAAVGVQLTSIAADDEDPGDNPYPTPSSRKVASSPLARRLARSAGIDIRTLRGSGPGGRIVRLDVEHEIRMSRKGDDSITIADNGSPASRACADPQDIPALPPAAETPSGVFCLQSHVSFDEMLILRGRINGALAQAGQVHLVDLLVKAVASTVAFLPAPSIGWDGNVFAKREEVDVAVLMNAGNAHIAPVIHGANRQNIRSISTQIRDAVSSAGQGHGEHSGQQAAAIALLDLTASPVAAFTPVPNGRHAAIVTVGAIDRRPVYQGEEIVPRAMATITLAANPGAINHFLAMEWMETLRYMIENPASILA